MKMFIFLAVSRQREIKKKKSYKKRNGLHVVRFGEAKKNIKKKIHQSI